MAIKNIKKIHMKHSIKNNLTSLIIFFLLILSGIKSESQTTIAAPINALNIYPKKISGDRDFSGNGATSLPLLTGTVRLQLSDNGAQILAFINLQLEQTEGDDYSNIAGAQRTIGRIDETRVIYNAPAGKKVNTIGYPRELISTFNTRLSSAGIVTIRGTTGSAVNYLRVFGETGNEDIGNNTPDDSYISVYFNSLSLTLEDLPAGVREIAIPKSALTGILTSQLSGTRGRVNTYGPRVGNSWFVGGESFLRFPDAIRRDPILFDQLYEIPVDQGRRYYFNDINLSGIRSIPQGQYIRVNLYWESDGPEVRGECVDNFFCGLGSPSIQLDSFVIQLDLRPAVQGGVFTYDQFDTQIGFKYNYLTDCGVLTALCTDIFRGLIQSNFFTTRRSLSDVLAVPETKNQISTALTNGVFEFIRTIGRFPTVTSLLDVTDGGNNLLVRCR
jgi:hypothetical protein